jgi:hypothetical protein
MIEKKLKFIITFSSTHDAIGFEKKMNQNFGRLVPVPVSITSGCGLCFMAETKDREKILAEAEKSSLVFENTYEVMI